MQQATAWAVTCRKYQEKGLAIMGYVKWSYDTLNHFCGDVFKAFGFSEEEGSIIKDVLLTADLYGIVTIKESRRGLFIPRRNRKLFLKHRFLL